MRTRNISFVIGQLSSVTSVLSDLELYKEVRLNLGNLSYFVKFQNDSFIIRKVSNKDKDTFIHLPFIIRDTQEFILYLVNTMFLAYDHDLQIRNRKRRVMIKKEALTRLLAGIPT